MRSILRDNKGFTLIELVVAVVLVGIMSMALAPVFSWMSATRSQLYDREQMQYNRDIRSGIMDYAAHQSSGTLPAPYTNSTERQFYSVADLTPTATDPIALLESINQKGVQGDLVTTDGTAGKNVRVYQRVANLTRQAPLFGSSGPVVNLDYDFGVIYLTDCGQDMACNTGIPGDSTTMTSLNYDTWDVSGDDKHPVFFSTLSIQKQKLGQTASRLRKIVGKIEEYTSLLYMSAAAGNTDNWNPSPTGAGAVDKSGANPATNHGCHDGWYDLSDSVTANILEQLGLSEEEYGKTAWGGRIEYCRDYEPLATSTASAGDPPHYSALRINKDVRTGSAPSSVIGNNVFTTF